MSTTSSTSRIDAYRAVCERYGVELDRDYSGAEDALEYLGGEKSIDGPWCAITTSPNDDSDFVYAYPGYETRELAEAKAVEHIDDSIFREWPEAIVNLDTDERFHPHVEITWGRG